MNQEISTFPHRFPPGYGRDLGVALHEPEIPLNVGSVARTCACTDIPLHLVGTLGFRLDSRLARRGGLDYWEHADVSVHRTWEEFESAMEGRRLLLFSTKGTRAYWDNEYSSGDIFVFGCERTGLPERLLEARPESVLTIPMVEGRRSLNVSNAVAVVVYEALRQLELKQKRALEGKATD
jgi:tRNA (cytidine/uridine-2'-O-)-methyltransferase